MAEIGQHDPDTHSDDSRCYRKLAAAVVAAALHDLVCKPPRRIKGVLVNGDHARMRRAQVERDRESAQLFLLGQGGHADIRAWWCHVLDMSPDALSLAVTDWKVRARLLRQING